MASDTVTKLQEISQQPFTDEKERKELYDAAIKLAYSVESPQDTAQRLYHGHLPLATAQTGIDLKLFSFLSDNSEETFTVDQLSITTGANPTLLGRLLRFYASHGMVQQVTQDDSVKYGASNITHNLSIGGTAAGIKHYSLTMTPAYNAIPKFLSKTAYSNPFDSAPFNLAFGTDMPVFEWRKYNQENAKAGQAFMAAQRMGQRSVWDQARSESAPVNDFKMSEEDINNRRVMMADVGAGFGHQSIDLRKHHPELKGRIVAEDLPLVQNMITNREELVDLDISLVTHDFMEEQPVKGAKVYYLRNVIHNWNDKPSQVILSQISRAMTKDSILILDEVVMPEVGATWKQASMDLAMMTMLAAMERTKEQFTKLLADSGLRLRDVWTYDQDYGDSLIYAEPLVW